ncbi:MAG: ABC transporter permease subunit [Coriobacteriia bacterium]|nr:ABC transporter permease subunit [Coriobacteriia bacterium]
MASVWTRSAARRVLAVAALTFREARRRWVVVAAAAMTLGYLALYGAGLYFASRDIAGGAISSMDEVTIKMIGAQMLSLGLFPSSLIVGLVAVFSSVGSVSGELDSSVAHGPLTRPIRRSEYVLGKFVGLAAMLTVYSLAVMGSVVGLAVGFMDAPTDNLAAAIALFVLEPLILCGVAVFGSTRLPTLANGVLCTALYGIGFIGGVIEQIGSIISNQVMLNIGIVTSLLLPVDAVHRKAVTELLPSGVLLDPSGGGVSFGASAVPSGWMVAYAVAFPLIMILLGMRVLQKRDL